jgi:hypothetical protein
MWIHLTLITDCMIFAKWHAAKLDLQRLDEIDVSILCQDLFTRCSGLWRPSYFTCCSARTIYKGLGIRSPKTRMTMLAKTSNNLPDRPTEKYSLLWFYVMYLDRSLQTFRRNVLSHLQGRRVWHVRNQHETLLHPDRPWGITTSYPMGTRALFTGVNRPARKNDHSLIFSAEVTDSWSHASISLYVFIAWHVTKHRGQSYHYLSIRRA